MALRAGEWVEVRSKDEILRTLDKNGRLEEMPFMPQMFAYCGMLFMVYKRAHKTCDPIYTIATRRVSDAVHLNLRCDGEAYGGCQAGCLLFWKEAWLKPVGAAASKTSQDAPSANRPAGGACTEKDVWNATRIEDPRAPAHTRYVCQTTQLPIFSRALPWWTPKQYVEDYRSGNATLTELLRGAIYVVMGRRGGRKFPLLRRIHDALQSLVGGRASPVRNGSIPLGSPVPTIPLDLQAGDLVRVKPHDKVLATINANNWHAGLYFDVEMVPFCGRVFRVRARVETFIDEKTGRLRQMKTPAVILEGVTCKSQFSKCRMFCPRSIYSWWREEWLERVSAPRLETAGSSEDVPFAPLAADRRTLQTAEIGN